MEFDDIYGNEFEDLSNENLDGNGNDDDDNHSNLDEEENQVEDALDSYLKSLGISDKNNIQWENEDTGEVESMSWDDLSEEDKLGILLSNTSNKNDLSDDEKSLIYQIRKLGLSPHEYIEFQQQQALREAQPEETPYYDIDNKSDEEIFLMSFFQQIPDATDEEAQEALDSAKANENLFKRQVEGLRGYYKQIEDDTNAQAEEEARKQEEYLQEAFANGIVDAINRFDAIGSLGLDLTNEDKDYLYNFLVGQDGAGNNYFTKAINNPDLLVRMAWFALNGEDVLNSIQDEAARLIKLNRTKSYNEGYEAGASGKQKKYDVTRKRSNKQKPAQSNLNSNLRQETVDSDIFDDILDGDW